MEYWSVLNIKNDWVDKESYFMDNLDWKNELILKEIVVNAWEV